MAVIKSISRQREVILELDDGKEVFGTIQKGGGRCDWVIYLPNGQMIEVLFVGSNKRELELWAENDYVILGHNI